MSVYSNKLYLFLMALVLAALPMYGAGDSWRNLDERICPILDTPYRTFTGIEVAYGFPSSTGSANWGDLSVYEIDAWIRCLTLENESGGELEIQAQWNSLIMQMSDQQEEYSLNRAGLALVWSQRFVHGFGLQINATPGLYSDLEAVSGKDFSVPCGITVIQALSKNFAFFTGVRVYPTFQKVIDPVAGLYWSSRNDVVVQLGYPESRFEYSPNKILRLIAGARLWLWPDYNMGDDERQRLLFSEGRTFGGIELACGKHTLITMKGGYLFSRKISFEEEADDVEIDNAPFVSLGLSGRF